MTTLLHILQHALGRDEYGRQPYPRADGADYRNHVCVSEGGADCGLCRRAVTEGLMREHAPSEISGGDPIFTVTDAGRDYIAAHSPKPPRLTRSAQRYRRFLSEDGSETFGEWLRMQKHRDRSERP